MIGCKKEINDQKLLENTVTIFRDKLPQNIIFYRSTKNVGLKNTDDFKFLNVKELLDNLDERFLLVSLKKYSKDEIETSIYSYKTGESLTCVFGNNGKLISKEIRLIKPQPTKSYYIYYEILKRKDPKYMDWDLFPIPKDSLK